MHLYAKLRRSCSVALLSVWMAAISLSACESTVLVGEACAAACEDDHTEGLETYRGVINGCVCDGCSDACTQSVCHEKQTPTDACLPCVQESLSGDACNVHAGLFAAACLTTKDCGALVECLVACPH